MFLTCWYTCTFRVSYLFASLNSFSDLALEKVPNSNAAFCEGIELQQDNEIGFLSILREFVSLNAVGNALSQCSKVFGVTHIVLLPRSKCSV